MDATDARIDILKEVAGLEARCKLLFSSVAAPSRFGDQTLILGL